MPVLFSTFLIASLGVSRQGEFAWGCRSGVASEARRLGVSISTADETELPPAAAICPKGTNALANQRLEHRREEAKVRRDHRLKLVVEDVLFAWPGHQPDTGDSA
jgi:hypothetical protein